MVTKNYEYVTDLKTKQTNRSEGGARPEGLNNITLRGGEI